MNTITLTDSFVATCQAMGVPLEICSSPGAQRFPIKWDGVMGRLTFSPPAFEKEQLLYKRINAYEGEMSLLGGLYLEKGLICAAFHQTLRNRGLLTLAGTSHFKRHQKQVYTALSECVAEEMALMTTLTLQRAGALKRQGPDLLRMLFTPAEQKQSRVAEMAIRHTHEGVPVIMELVRMSIQNALHHTTYEHVYMSENENVHWPLPWLTRGSLVIKQPLRGLVSETFTRLFPYLAPETQNTEVPAA